jgi:hypothetical protein
MTFWPAAETEAILPVSSATVTRPTTMLILLRFVVVLAHP